MGNFFRAGERRLSRPSRRGSGLRFALARSAGCARAASTCSHVNPAWTARRGPIAARFAARRPRHGKGYPGNHFGALKLGSFSSSASHWPGFRRGVR